MADTLWLNHPRFVPVREEVLAQLESQEVHFRKVLPVVFLCGGFESRRRDRLAQYLKSHHGDRLLLFYADDVWPLVAKQPAENALGMERDLADLSDLLIIVVESPGTFAELGAFALQEDLRQKLLPILDRQYRGDDSFINTGPIAWVNQDSRFGPAIWADHETILDAVDEVDRRLASLPPQRAHRVPELATSPKHMVFFLADLAAIFGPCPYNHIAYYARRILGRNPSLPLPTLVGLACAMNVLETVVKDTEEYYYRPLDVGELRPYQRSRYLNLPQLRARVLSAMLTIGAVPTMGGDQAA